MVVILLGSRFGGKAVPAALDEIDFSMLQGVSCDIDSIKENKNNLSVTQLEILKAIECKIPIYTFINDGVMHDQHTYEKNKKKKIINEIEFPNIDKQETAKYIFEFINFLRHRVQNNAVFEFSKFEDIETLLKKQVPRYFQWISGTVG